MALLFRASGDPVSNCCATGFCNSLLSLEEETLFNQSPVLAPIFLLVITTERKRRERRERERGERRERERREKERRERERGEREESSPFCAAEM